MAAPAELLIKGQKMKPLDDRVFIKPDEAEEAERIFTMVAI